MRNIRPYLEVLPDSLREMVLLAQGMKHAQERAHGVSSHFFGRADEPESSPGCRQNPGGHGATRRRNGGDQPDHAAGQTDSDLALTLHALLGAAVILIALRIRTAPCFFLLNARKIAEETKNPEAARKAKSLMKSLA